ncbi:MAG: putative tricarboxylic transport membrane protein [Desulforhopalus sp.]
MKKAIPLNNTLFSRVPVSRTGTTSHKFVLWHILLVCGLALHLTCVVAVQSFELERPECIAPAKPGGGHDIMCQLLAASVAESLLLDMSIRFMPGGIGALAFNYAVNVRQKDASMVVAVSTGTALNLALHKFGKYTEADVRWLGAVGTDYGVIAVRDDAPWHSLDELIDTLQQKPDTVVLGAAGSIGSQDWMKMALVLDKAGINPKSIRYASFEGGGEASQALIKNYIQVFPGDFTEVVNHMEEGKLRILAIFSDKRLPGKYSNIPTAKELGYDIVWPVWRGFYLPPEVSSVEYHWWVNTLYRLESSGVLAREREKLHLFPLMIIGEEFDRYVKNNVRQLRQFGQKFGLVQ